jgi:hypothetical protein
MRVLMPETRSITQYCSEYCPCNPPPATARPAVAVAEAAGASTVTADAELAVGAFDGPVAEPKEAAERRDMSKIAEREFARRSNSKASAYSCCSSKPIFP